MATTAREAPDASDRDPLATQLRGFGPVGLLAILVILSGNLLFVPLSALLVLAWAHRSRTPWRELGFVRPASWPRAVVLGIVLGSAFKLVLKAVVMPLLAAPALNPRYHYLAHNPAALAFALYAIVIGAGFGEETVFRGYFFERLEMLLGRGTGARIAIVVVTALLFGAAHLKDQGLAGAEQGAIVGLVFGSVFARRRSLVPLMIAHASFDLTALALIYWGWEGAVAHLLLQ